MVGGELAEMPPVGVANCHAPVLGAGCWVVVGGELAEMPPGGVANCHAPLGFGSASGAARCHAPLVDSGWECEVISVDYVWG